MSKAPSKPSPSALKKQMLRQAVEDNVATITGERPMPRAQGRGHKLPRVAWLVPVLILGLSVPLISSFAGRSDSMAPEIPDDEAAMAAATTEMADPADLVEMPKPRIDDSVQIFDSAPALIDPSVFPLEVRKIVVDPGHGGEDTGTTGEDILEKDITLDISLRLAEQLRADGFEVTLTRDDDTFVSLRERSRIANDLGADLFVSVHINWIVDRKVRGLETYFLGATDDPYLNALARRENRASGYSLADMRTLLESIYTDVRKGQSRRLASSVQGSLLTSLRRDNPQLENRGVKTAPFVVLVATEMPAILAEVSCLSNRDEARLLQRPLYREHIATALSRGIRRYADDVNQIEEKGT